jgi:hypothetical protein
MSSKKKDDKIAQGKPSSSDKKLWKGAFEKVASSLSPFLYDDLVNIILQYFGNPDSSSSSSSALPFLPSFPLPFICSFFSLFRLLLPDSSIETHRC